MMMMGICARALIGLLGGEGGGIVENYCVVDCGFLALGSVKISPQAMNTVLSQPNLLLTCIGNRGGKMVLISQFER